MKQSRLDFDQLNGPDFEAELRLKAQNVWPVAGLDEAGRGPLAGPVVAAAVILDHENIPSGLNDSKKLTERKRESLFEDIMQSAHVSICSKSARFIDQTDIRKASLMAMEDAYFALCPNAAYGLIDGRDVPDKLQNQGAALIKGDARSLSIAAASIIAKVTRDRMMARAGEIYPAYGFEKHAGYGTKFHREQIETCGPCPLHRMSFRPLRED